MLNDKHWNIPLKSEIELDIVLEALTSTTGKDKDIIILKIGQKKEKLSLFVNIMTQENKKSEKLPWYIIDSEKFLMYKNNKNISIHAYIYIHIYISTTTKLSEKEKNIWI